MNTKINRQINYLNEALLLTSYICRTESSNDGVLPIDYKKMSVSQNEIEKDNEDILHFLKNIRTDARKIIGQYPGIQSLFRVSDDSDIPEALYFLIYSKLKQSIRDYSIDEFQDMLRVVFLENMEALGYQLSEMLNFEDIDQLSLFSEHQRYMLYKVLKNIGNITKDLYDILLMFEDIIQKHDDLIQNKIQKYSKKLENENVFNLCDEQALENVVKSCSVETVEYTILIQFGQLYGLSLISIDGEVGGYIFFGLVPLIQSETKVISHEKKEEMFSKFSPFSDYTRFNILVLLSKKMMYGRELAEELSISTGTTSHHLTNLLKAELLTTEVHGKRIYYKINPAMINKMSIFLNQLGGTDEK